MKIRVTHLYKCVSKVTGSVHHRQVAPCHNFGLQFPRHDVIISLSVKINNNINNIETIISRFSTAVINADVSNNSVD